MPSKKKAVKPIQMLPATVYVVIGATGDLMKKKLVPALYQLYRGGMLPKEFAIVGFSRKPYTDASFRSLVRSFLPKHSTDTKLSAFLRLFHYQQGEFHDPSAYTNLLRHIQEFDDAWRVCSSTLIHLAVPPTLYQLIIQNIVRSGLTKKCSDKEGWSRLLIEKPFGKDVKTAESLDARLARLFKEKQIFRVDHYLAKETLQNILTFRFSNALFEPIWTRQYIERIDIKLLEKSDIGSRGAFYDDTGALKDVGQNHILQMLALIAMEHPGDMRPDSIRKARAKVMKSLKKIGSMQLKSSVIRGQYEGYTSAPHVLSTSTTETYFKVRAEIANSRWYGVPIYLESGKALSQKKTEIAVHFKPMHDCWCGNAPVAHRHQNKVIFSVQPTEGISITFWSKKSNLVSEIEPRIFHFNYRQDAGMEIDPYAKLLFDAVRGDQTLFSSTDEVIASWHFVTPIIKAWKKLPLYMYAKGSRGPKQSLVL